MWESTQVVNHTKVSVVNNIEEVHQTLKFLIDEGYQKGNLFVITHEDSSTERISDVTEANEIGVMEEGPITAIANLFRSKGDQLRAKLRSMGVSSEEAERLESEMDNSKVIILAWGGEIFDNENYDSTIKYHYEPWL
jgi:hypothetical protein